ncbi:MAG: TetR/AcrR family transcriptional regulator [Intrasporangium sp.]|uniref:TetR/AcrR family transcriptional regulator n=1 Tax=Intrasporangium sp. TaxID=1925024 RepID=UPI00264A3401|nr:TetR/AcrR family transcriptional regulator [Intrasporangium sp.]MDN5796646.1 TetR/AcrR family transcriptional regulator [Intrasporangium sp.]
MAQHTGKVPLSRQAIVEAAIALADAEGLDAVSIRSVAAVLRARPMSLYRFIDSKDDLVADMVDEVIAEMLLKQVPADWRDAMRAIARRTIQIGRRHPWLLAATTRITGTGPHRAQHADQSLQAMASLGLSEGVVRPLLVAVDVYTMGFALSTRPGRTRAQQRADDRALDQGLGWLLDGFARSHLKS